MLFQYFEAAFIDNQRGELKRLILLLLGFSKFDQVSFGYFKDCFKEIKL